MAESLSPVQGLIAISDKKTIYGLPLGLPVGGGGTIIRASLPPQYKMGGGMKAILLGAYNPVVYPPIVVNPIYNLPGGSGAVAVVIPDANIPKPQSAGAARAVVIPDANIPKGRQGSGMFLGEVVVVPP